MAGFVVRFGSMRRVGGYLHLMKNIDGDWSRKFAGDQRDATVFKTREEAVEAARGNTSNKSLDLRVVKLRSRQPMTIIDEALMKLHKMAKGFGFQGVRVEIDGEGEVSFTFVSGFHEKRDWKFSAQLSDFPQCSPSGDHPMCLPSVRLKRVFHDG